MSGRRRRRRSRRVVDDRPVQVDWEIDHLKTKDAIRDEIKKTEAEQSTLLSSLAERDEAADNHLVERVRAYEQRLKESRQNDNDNDEKVEGRYV